MNRQIRRRPVMNVLENTALHPVLQRVYAARGVQSLADMPRSLTHLLPYTDMLGCVEAGERLARAVQDDATIVIVGDFDADGATSTAVMVRCLEQFGATQVHYLVPNRFKTGYGLTPALVDAAHERFQPSVLVTVDNGICQHEGVAAAKALGMEVLVTDHHLPGDTLPDADCIVNPNQPGCPFQSKALAGVGVAFYVMIATRAALREVAWFERQGFDDPNLAECLDWVALGTVADVVPMDQNNRLLVHQGLLRLRHGHASLGLQALLAVSRKAMEHLSASDLGYAVAPRLNAAGRLDDMSVGVACLLTEHPVQADALAARLNDLNQERRDIEKTMQAEALSILDALDVPAHQQHGVSLFNPSWHQGVVGIVASRLKERLQRPVAVFTQTKPEEIKGSLRSIPQVNLRDVLDQVHALNPGIMVNFGGHAVAAGATIASDKFHEFAEAFDEEVAQAMAGKDTTQWVETDGCLDAADLNLELAEALRQGGPWGQGFPEPLFDGVFALVEQRVVGQNHLKMLLQPDGSDHCVHAILFNADMNQWPNNTVEHVELVYRLDINEFRGTPSLQLIVQHLRPAKSTVPGPAHPAHKSVACADC